jgi:hypothetical protein
MGANSIYFSLCQRNDKWLERSYIMHTSVADPGCLYRILIFIHPGSRIPDPATATKEERGKICFPTFFSSQEYHKLNFFFNRYRKKLEPIHKGLVTFAQKFVTKLSKVRVWDPDPQLRCIRVSLPRTRILVTCNKKDLFKFNGF